MTSAVETSGPSSVPVKNQTLAKHFANVFSWLTSLWLIVMAAWYVSTANEAFKYALNRGDDRWWARIWIGIAVAIALTHLVVRRRLISFIWGGSILGTALLMIYLSHRVTAALVLVWLLILAWVWGDWALGKMGVGAADVVERIAIGVPLGLALMGPVILALSMTRLLAPKWALLIFAILTLLQWRSLYKLVLNFHRWFVSDRPFGALTPLSPDIGILVAFMGFVFLLDLSWALAPEVHFDALAAHLPLSKSYVEHPVSLVSYSGYIANLANLHFALGFSLQGETAAKLIVLASSVLGAIGVFALGRMLFSARVGLWAAALFFTTPLVSWLATTAYIDAQVTLFLLAALLAFFRWHEEPRNGWLWACGLLTGAALATKLNALLGLPVVGLVILWTLIRSHDPLKERAKGLGGYFLGILIIAGPGLALAYALTGNPFYPLPLFAKLFKTTPGLENLISNSHLFGTGTSPSTLVRLPWDFTFHTNSFGEALPKGGVGLALMLLPLCLGILITGGGALRRRVAIMLAACLVYVSVQAYIMQYGRYYIPVLPLVVVLAVAAIFHFSKMKWLRRFNLLVLGIVVAAQIAMTPLLYWNIPERFPMKVAFGQETRESFSARAVRLYGPFTFMNTIVKPNEKVIAAGGEMGRIYLNAHVSIPYDPKVVEIIRRSTDDNIAANLIAAGYTHLFLNRDSWHSTLPYYFLTEPFLNKFADMQYTHNRFSIYRLRATPLEAGTVTNLIPNPGFETLSGGFPTEWVPFGQPRVSQTGSKAHGGKVYVTANPAGGMYARLSVEPGKIYSLGFWCRADKPGQLARQQINWLDANLQIVVVNIDAINCGPEWTWQKYSVMSPQGAPVAQVYVMVHENSEVSFDDYMFVQGQLPTPPLTNDAQQ